MKTVESSRLYFKDDKSDKVYEADLCAVDDDLYVVNFRYGRRGSDLREGTKTVFPVAYDEAKRVFNALVASKVKKGYLTADGQVAELVKEVIPDKIVSGERDKVILRHLRDAASDSYYGPWKLSRIIWRAGELRLQGSASLIARLIKIEDSYQTYSAIWTLTQLERNEGHEAVYEIYKTLDPKTKTHRLAVSYLMSVEGSRTKEVYDEIEKSIPTLLLPVTKGSDIQAMTIGINELIRGAGATVTSLLVNLYHMSGVNENLYQALYDVIEDLPTKINYFKPLRYILKLAEMNSDYRFLGLLSKKIHLNNHNYSANAYSTYIDGKYVNVWKTKGKENTLLSFSDKTKNYLSKRMFRMLNKVSVEQPENYTKMALGVLLSVSDAKDNKEIYKDIQYSFDYTNWTSIEEVSWLPKYHNYVAYLSILYGGSERFESAPNFKSWRFKENQQESNDLEVEREERNPNLWDESPKEVIELLAKGEVKEVLNMALKIFKANPGFEGQLDDVSLTHMIINAHAPVGDLAVEILEKRYVEKMPSKELISLLLCSPSEKGVALGLKWLEKYKTTYLSKTEDVCHFVLLGQEKVLEFLESNLDSSQTIGMEKAIFSHIAPLVYHPEKYSETFLKGLSDFVKKENISPLFSDLAVKDVQEVMKSQDMQIMKFGLALATINKESTYTLTSGIVDRLLSSQVDELRSLGLSLLAEYPESYLLEKNEIILDYCFSEYPEVRDGVVPIAERLISIDDDFNHRLFSRLVRSIGEKETYDGLHESNLNMLNRLYKERLKQLPTDKVIELLLSKIDVAQKLGEAQYFDQKLSAKLGLTEYVLLSNSDIRSIRKEVERFHEDNVGEIRYKLAESLGVLDSDWMDMRSWACNFYLEHTEAQDWHLELILSVADSPKDDVQSFGRTLISKLFASDEGEKLMLCLSEHPSKNMMLFTSNYLALHAKDNPEVVIQLRQYFKNILFSINTGATAKERVFAFLKQESVKDKRVAEMVANLMQEVIQTNAKGDKSSCIDVLVAIKEQFDDVDVPVKIVPIKKYEHAV